MSRRQLFQLPLGGLIRGVAHTKRLKNFARHVRAEIGGADFEAIFVLGALSAICFAGEMRDYGLEVKVTFAGIHEFLAGLEIDLERFVTRAPILKPGGMRED